MPPLGCCSQPERERRKDRGASAGVWRSGRPGLLWWLGAARVLLLEGGVEAAPPPPNWHHMHTGMRELVAVFILSQDMTRLASNFRIMYFLKYIFGFVSKLLQL